MGCHKSKSAKGNTSDGVLEDAVEDAEDEVLKGRCWRWNGESKSQYIFQNRDQRTKYLTLTKNRFHMSTANNLQNSRFKFYFYTPVDNGPRAFINLTNKLPLDHGKPTRIGEHGKDLRGRLCELRDNRIFFTRKQENTNQFTFQLASQQGSYLTTDAEGNLTTTEFMDIKDVDESGLFNVVRTSEVGN